MKTKARIHSVFFAMAILAGNHSALAQPAIGVSTAGKQSVLFWPSTPTNYILQSSTNLASSNWVSAADAVSVIAESVSNTSPARFFRLLSTNAPAGMVLIPAGAFTMGATALDTDIADASPTNVYVSACYMDSNLVSLNFWQTVYNAAVTFDGYSFAHAGAGKAANHPVQTVDWFDVVKWCNARSQLAGLTPVYYTDTNLTQVFNTGEVTVYAKWTANGFRLPTEAEWEKAARGGLNGRRFPWGNRIDENQANYIGTTNSYSYDLGPNGYNPIGSIGGTSVATSPVGSFDMNGYGLYDMAGNVEEWCWDWYGTPYAQPTAFNPTGPATGDYHILRGGYWNIAALVARCAERLSDNANDTGFNNIGFRCVRGL